MNESECLRSVIRENLLLERAWGANATVYHGSNMPPEGNPGGKGLIDILIDDEVESRGDVTYGRGLYTVSDLMHGGERTQTIRGEYGKYLYKLKVNLRGYVILDDEIEKRVWGEKLGVVGQLGKLGLPKDVIKQCETIVKKKWPPMMTAAQLAEILSGRVRGLVFPAKSKSHVMGMTVVIYDPSTVVPMAWTKTDGDEQSEDDLEWNSLIRGGKSSDRLKAAVARSAGGEWKEERYVATTPDRELKRLAGLPPGKERTYGIEYSQEGGEGDLLLRQGDDATKRVKELPGSLRVPGSLDLTGNRTLKELPMGLHVGGDLILKGSLIGDNYPEDEDIVKGRARVVAGKIVR